MLGSTAKIHPSESNLIPKGQVSQIYLALHKQQEQNTENLGVSYLKRSHVHSDVPFRFSSLSSNCYSKYIYSIFQVFTLIFGCSCGLIMHDTVSHQHKGLQFIFLDEYLHIQIFDQQDSSR